MEHTLRLGLWVLLLAGLTACGGGGGGTTAAPGTSPTPGAPTGDLTVVAHVYTAPWRPSANVAVVINGVGPLLTDATGDVTFTNVAVPYEAIVFDAERGVAQVVRGLTRADPVFRVDRALAQREVLIEGTVSGGAGFPLPPEHEIRVFVHPDGGYTRPDFGPSPNSGGYVAPGIAWEGPDTTQVTVLALQYSTGPTGQETEYTGYGSRTIQVVDGETYTHVDVALGPVATETVAVDVRIPFNLDPFDGSASVHLADGPSLRLQPIPADDDVFAFRVPRITDSTVSFSVGGMSPQSIHSLAWLVGLRPPTTSVSLTVPSQTECGFPIQGATGVDHTTPFYVGPSTGDRVYQYHFQAQGGGPVIRVSTTESSITIPDLTVHGIELPPGAPGHWKVDGLGPATSIDELFDPDRVLGQPTETREGFQSTMTQWWEFTFAP